MMGRVRKRIAKLLRHTYTRVAHIDTLDSASPQSPSTDEYGEPIMTFAPPVTGIPCLLDDSLGNLQRSSYGAIEISQFLMYVAHDDPLNDGDEIRDLADPREGLVYVKSAVVEADENAAAGGRRAFRIFRLREVSLP